MQLHYDIIVTGKVQGVWFRDSTKRKALELGIKGFVRNERDGSVYIEAEGEKAVLHQLASWCKQGPPKAIVEHVQIKEASVKQYKDFTISR